MNQRVRDQIQQGMVVRSGAGERLGRVVALGEQSFEIERGFFFPRGSTIDYADVAEVRNGEIVIGSRTAADLAASAAEPAGAEPEPAATERRAVLGPDEEVCIPLAEEQLSVQKRVIEVGAVRVSKVVVTELRQVTVPVTREVVRIERVAAPAGAVAESAFQEETLVIPVRQEVAEIEKRTVVREEVRISRVVVQSDQTSAATVRSERLEVEAEGDVAGCELPAPISESQR